MNAYLNYEMLNYARNLFMQENQMNEKRYLRLERIIIATLEAIREGRNEGILALEFWIHEKKILKENYPEDFFLKNALQLYVEGVNALDIEEILQDRIMIMGPTRFEGYLAYLITKALLTGNSGELPWLYERKLLACVPCEVRERLEEGILTWKHAVSENTKSFKAKKWEQITTGKVDNPLMVYFEKTMEKSSDIDIQRFLREIDNMELAIILLFCDEKIKNAFSKNMSTNLKAVLWDYSVNSSKDTLADALISAIRILCQLEEEKVEE